MAFYDEQGRELRTVRCQGTSRPRTEFARPCPNGVPAAWARKSQELFGKVLCGKCLGKKRYHKIREAI